MEHSVGGAIFTIQGLRYAMTNHGRLIDQYGRIFLRDSKGKPGKFYGVGYATH